MLVGRAEEWAAIERLLTRATGSEGGVLLVRGEAGIGKSTLLGQVASHPGLRVLRAAGVESESDMPYAAAHQLLRPLLPLLDRVPAAQADAVRVALGMGGSGSPDRFLVALGFLSLVSEAGTEQPVVLIVDDVQWCDQASVDALLFVGRRMGADPVVLALGHRDESGEPTDVGASLAGIPELVEVHLEGFDAAGVAALVEDLRGISADGHVCVDLVSATRGNPLALVEVTGLLSRDQLLGKEQLPERLPVGDRLERFFLARAAGLTPRARRLLLTAAAEETGEVDLIVAVAGMSDDSPSGGALATVAEVEATGLVAVQGSRLVFRHPLARSALWGAATAQEQLATHEALAEGLLARGERDRALWHRAAASLAADDALAAELEGLATRSGQRSAHASAAAALDRAAALSAEGDDRTRRLLLAADAAWLAGQPQRCRALTNRAETSARTPVHRAGILYQRARAASRSGDVDQAHRLFLAAADLLRDAGPEQALEMYAEAVEAAAYSGDLARLREIATLAGDLQVGGSVRAAFLAAWVDAANRGSGDPRAVGVRPVEDALVLADQLGDPRLLVWAGITALTLGDVAAMDRFYRLALDTARAAGAVGSLPYVFEHSSVAQAFAGQFQAARTAAEEGLRLAVETEQQRSAGQLLAVLAFVAGTVGDDSCVDLAARAREIAEPRGIGLTVATAAWAVARLDLACGRYDQAADRLTALRRAGPGRGHPTISLWSMADLVESAVRARRGVEVADEVELLAGLAEKTGRRGAVAAAAWCRALLGGPDAERQLASAAEAFAAQGLPLAEARSRLFLGELLRRDRRPTDARVHLRAAVEGFRALGATPWVERSVGELRATGDATPVREASGLEQLTAQELQIVKQVAEGASNREIASRLFISPRTVEYHLYKAYPKLGISSRTQLMHAFRDELAVLERV